MKRTPVNTTYLHVSDHVEELLELLIAAWRRNQPWFRPESEIANGALPDPCKGRSSTSKRQDSFPASSMYKPS